MSLRRGPSSRHASWLAGRGAMVVGLLCLVAILPLLRGQPPCTHDGRLHFFRVAAMRGALRERIVFSRWLPNLAFGYGFPFFNYRAPLSYYLTLGLHLVGLSLPWALNMVYVLSLVASGLGAYLLGRDLFGTPAGVVAGVAYAYAPYQLLDALVRGNAPESLALALLPFNLWAFRRLTLRGGRGWFVGSVALLAGLYLTHNISSLLFTPFLLTYTTMLACVHRGQSRWREAGLAFLLALGLTAFFWLPALAEKDYVQLYLTGATRNNDFHHNFLSLAEVLAPPQAFDTSYLNPPLRVRLGLVPTGLAVLSLVGTVFTYAAEAGRRGRIERRTEGEIGQTGIVDAQDRAAVGPNLLFFAVTAALFVFMSTPGSVWLWERLPLLRFVQFPWRFVGRAALPIALMAGAAVSLVRPGVSDMASKRSTTRRVATAILPSLLAGAIMLVALPSTYPPRGYCPMASMPTIEDVHRYERNSGLVGIDPVGAYFPVWVEQRPEGSVLEPEYAGEEEVVRFDMSVLPEGALVLASEYGPNRARLTVQSPRNFEARYLSFYFPGWRVWIDGDPVEVSASDRQGLITFTVPQGLHEVTVRFGETSLRLAADAASAVSLLGLVVSLIFAGGALGSRTPGIRSVGLGRVGVVGLLLTAALLPLLKVTIVDQVRTPFRTSRLKNGDELRGVAHPLDQAYADGLTLIGYEQSTDRGAGSLTVDQVLRVDLYWTVRRRPAGRYQTVVHMVGPQGLRWSSKDSYRPTDYEGAPPTTTWQPGHYAVDSHEVELLPGTPPGRYELVLTVFERDSLTPLSILNDEGQPAAPELVLGQIDLARPRHHPDPDALTIQYREEERMGPLTLLGANVSHEEAAPGDAVTITAFWRVDEGHQAALTMNLRLLRQDGTLASEYTRPPVAAWYPTTAWQKGDIWRGQHLLHLPASLESGTYTWALSLTSFPTVTLSQISIAAPTRILTRPPVEIPIEATLGCVATLIGVDIGPPAAADESGALSAEPGGRLNVRMVWRSEMTTPVSYRVFVHLLGPDGTLVAQADGIPAQWSRPTTGWIEGEYVTDLHTIQVPPDAPGGRYRLEAGLYELGGGRLTTLDGADSVPLAAVAIERQE